jgi:hypothetical protein
MADTVTPHRAIELPLWPSLDEAALESVRVDYDPAIDYLYVFLYGAPLPAVWDPRPDGDTWVGLRLVGDDDWTNEVVGIMIAHFRRHAVKAHPGWQEMPTATGKTRNELLGRLIADVAAMPLGGSAFTEEAE